MFDVERMETIDADLALARQGDRTAQMRVFDHHVPWLLTFARTVNDRIESGFYAGPEPGIGFAEEVTTDEDTEDAPEDASEGSEDSEDTAEAAPEAAEEIETFAKVPEDQEATEDDPFVPEADALENEDVLENDPDAPVDPDVIVGEPGSPVADDSEEEFVFEDPALRDDEDLEVENNGEAE